MHRQELLLRETGIVCSYWESSSPVPMFCLSNLLAFSSKNQYIRFFPQKCKLRVKSTNHSLLGINEFEFIPQGLTQWGKISAWECNREIGRRILITIIIVTKLLFCNLKKTYVFSAEENGSKRVQKHTGWSGYYVSGWYFYCSPN